MDISYSIPDNFFKWIFVISTSSWKCIMILFIWFQTIIQQIILPRDNMIHGYENLSLILSAILLYISKTVEEVIKIK